jgi:hypothetical protein
MPSILPSPRRPKRLPILLRCVAVMLSQPNSSKQLISVRFCLLIGGCASEALALLTLAMKAFIVIQGGPANCTRTDASVDSVLTDLGAPRQKIRRYLEILTRLGESVGGKTPSLWQGKPLLMFRYEFSSSWL